MQDDTAAQTTPDTSAAPDDAAAQSPAWWATLPEETQGFVKAKGLAEATPDDAVRRVLDMARNAEKKLGKPADRLIDRPAEGQDLTEWLASQRETLGLPADAKGYATAPPEGFPEAAWDADLATRAADLAHKLAVPKAAHDAYVRMFAEHVQGMDTRITEQIEAAQTAMKSELTREWGDQTDLRIERAAQAARALAEDAGLDTDALSNVGHVLAKGTGDAAVIRLFDALARATSEDSAGGLGKGGGLSMGPAQAQAQLAAMRGPDSEYQKALAEARTTGNRANLTRLEAERERLIGIIAAAQGG